MPLDISRIRALCFDIDGTLMDTDDLIVRQLTGWLARLRWPSSQSETKTLVRQWVMRAESPANRLYTWLDRFGLDGPLAALNEALYRRGWKKPGQLRMIAGVATTLRRLHHHYPLAVVSARGETVTHAFLAKHNFQPLFHTITTGQTLPRTKPRPDPILWTAGQLGVPVEACVMIGDTTVDIHAGKAAGAQTIGVLSGFGDADELQDAGADLILPSIPDLLPVLKLP